MSTAHRHIIGSECLTAMPTLWFGAFAEGAPVMVPTEGWWRCADLTDGGKLAGGQNNGQRWYPKPNGYLVHDHDGAAVAHETRTPCEFPGGAV